MNNLPDPISFESALEKFLIHLKDHQRSTATSVAYHGDLRQLHTYLTQKRITQATSVQTLHLEEFVAHLSTTGYTPKSISRKINSLKTFFKFLHESGLHTANPSSPLTHPKYESKAPRILTATEHRALRDAARLDIRTSAVIELLLQTGVRIGELANLRMEDLGKNEILVRAFENNSPRTVPLNKTAASALQNYLNIRPKVENDHLFITKTGHPLLVRNIRTAIDRYFQKAGVKEAKVNDLRHTFIAHQLRSGVHPDLLTQTE
ncbi:tyrosine-type recombinase/integrase [Candidatus Amesbacteria bacterium]|nr:tyrosine-type recombinase/integrase [Candidatus Amesbacteria bacterium]